MNKWPALLAVSAIMAGVTLSAKAQGPVASGSAMPRSIQRPEDHGDQYPVQGGVRRLLRVPGTFAITVKPGKSEDAVIPGLLKKGAALENFRQQRKVGKGAVIVQATGNASASSQTQASPHARAATHHDVLSCNPVFIDADSGHEIVLTAEIIVRLKPGVNASIYFGVEWSRARPLCGNTGPEYLLSLTNTSSDSVLATVSLHARHPDVEWSEPSMLSPLDLGFSPDDPLLTDQWHHDHTGQNNTKTNADIRSPQAWDITPGGSPDVVIAIIDTGVQRNHPDLAANIFQNPIDNTINGNDDDGNGYNDDVYGWDFANGDNDPTPTQPTGDSHGTACAGMTAAVGNNGIGVAGSAFNCKILPIKISETNVWVNNATLALAIRYAAGIDGAGNTTWRGADIISMSFGYGSNAVGNSALNDAASNGRNGRGCVLFAATGNSGSGYLDYGKSTDEFPPGEYFVQFEYFKDSSASGGSDTVWIANVQLPDANQTRHHFDSPVLPTNWTTGGNAPFTIEDNPVFAYGTERYQARSGSLGDTQVSWLRSPTFTLAPGTSLLVTAWVDTQMFGFTWSYPPLPNQGDWFMIRFYSVTAGSWYTNIPYESGVPGTRQFKSGGAVDLTPNWPSVNVNVIAVGGCTDMGYRYHGSQYLQTGLEFVAPTAGGIDGVWSTDQTGTAGYNTNAGVNGNYTAFSGTSAATPLAAGIGALLLSVNSNLSPAQVLQRMRVSCDKIGNVTYVNGTNLFYGYGRVNAYHALLSNSMPSVAVVSNDVVRNHRTYYARDTIEAHAPFDVMNGGNVTFRSGQKVDLQGFHARTGSVYRTVIDPSLQ